MKKLALLLLVISCSVAKQFQTAREFAGEWLFVHSFVDSQDLFAPAPDTRFSISLDGKWTMPNRLIPAGTDSYELIEALDNGAVFKKTRANNGTPPIHEVNYLKLRVNKEIIYTSELFATQEEAKKSVARVDFAFNYIP